MNKRNQVIVNAVVAFTLLFPWPAAYHPAASGRALPPASEQPAAAQPPALPPRDLPVRPATSSFWADVDGDQDVDAADLQAVAEIWNCTTGQPCYDPAFDRDSDGDIDALDLATLGNEYDVSPPEITITTPAGNAVVGGTAIQVTGTVSDVHTVTAVIVNGVAASLNNGTFQATVPLAAGNQAITASAADEVGQESSLSRLVFADQDGPFVTIHEPENRQSVYSLRPAIVISYTDFYTAVNPATLQVILTDEAGATTDVTTDLVVGPAGASGTLSFDLVEETAYTLTATLEDTLSNPGALAATFYVPAGAAGITPPAEPDSAGWVSGVVYDSSTCDPYLVACQGIAGASVTLAALNETALQEARQARALELAAHEPGRAPLSPPEVAVTTPVSGTIITGPDGFFAFPVAATGRYTLRVEKDGYTYSQRVAEIVRGHSAPVNEIYVTPLDPAVTLCDETGCSHASADGQMELVIPAGAIAPGDVLTVTATEFDRVVFLPSGELPPGTWETYAFNLGDDSDYQFLQPVTVRVANSRGFAAGEVVPLGFWNADLLQWEHAGTATIDAAGQWVEMEVMHFSNYDPNCALPAGIEADGEEFTEDDDGECAEDPCGSAVTLRAGHLRQDVTLPPVQALDQPIAPTFNYASEQAAPSGVIEAQFNLDLSPGVVLSNYVQIELFIEGEKTANFSFAADSLSQDGQIGHFRYLWDGRDAQGRRLPPGAYPYALHVRVPYQAQYYRTLGNLFGYLIDYTRPMNVFTNATADTWLFGSVKLTGDPASPFGAGWSLAGVQQLYEDESGRILIDDGAHNATEYYFPYKNLLPSGDNPVPAADSNLAGLYGNQSSPEPAAGPAPAAWLAPQTVENSPAVIAPAAEVAPAVPSEAPVDASPVTAAPQPVYNFGQPAADPLGPVVLRTPLTTTVSGPIITHTTWTTAGSPYILTADVIVNPGITLTIEPGVVVMGQTNAELQVQGHLEAIGAPAQPITFTSATDSGPTQWQG
ncbi:MAG: dockerin type I domain-containing protein, partial [Chloroflexi bacterium]|nr:dockerin type I domain-containing protein [Chloroflexota bacterium]